MEPRQGHVPPTVGPACHPAGLRLQPPSEAPPGAAVLKRPLGTALNQETVPPPSQKQLKLSDCSNDPLAALRDSQRLQVWTPAAGPPPAVPFTQQCECPVEGLRIQGCPEGALRCGKGRSAGPLG